MARRSKSRSTRDSNYITTRSVRSPFSNRPARITFPLTSFEDFRRWEPEVTDDRYPRTFPRALALPVKAQSNVFFGTRHLAMPRLFRPVSTGMGFTSPSSIVLCARRRTRKRVLHALGKAGRGGQARPRYTANSLIHC